MPRSPDTQRATMLGQLLAVGVVEVDAELRVLDWSRRMARWTHIARSEALGRHLGELFPAVEGVQDTLDRIARALERGRSLRLEPPSGEVFLPVPVVKARHYRWQQQHLFVRPFKENGERRALVVLRDVTQVALWVRAMEYGVAHFREQAAGALEEARTDDLTGLLNRGPALAAVSEAMEDQEEAMVLLVDLDHFKRVNDTWGHLAGDAVLREVSRRIRDKVRRTDIVARYGGEEILIVLPGAPRHIGMRAARSILGAIRGARIPAPTLSGDTELLQITASAGLARWRSDQELDSVLALADEALYRAKEAGRDRLETA